MMCLGWAKGIECSQQRVPNSGTVAGCPDVTWFWWAAAAAVVLGLWQQNRRRRA